MKKIHVFWTTNSEQLTHFLRDIEGDPSVKFIPADEQSGDGEEMYTADINRVRSLASLHGCTVKEI